MIRLLKHIIRPLWSRIRNIFTELQLLQNNPTLKLGDYVTAKECSFGECVYLASKTVLINTELGDFSYCGEGVKLASVKIGEFTCIGPGVAIGLGNHPLNKFVSIHPAFYSTAAQVGKTFVDEQHFEENPLPTKIGSDVWIGANVIIPGGITIGDGAVIASGAVVIRDVLPYEIVGGIPAKRIKMRFEDDIIKSLLKSQWWNWTLEEIEFRSSQFRDVDSFTEWLDQKYE